MPRYLTQAEANRCENAREPVCKCRCGGEKHGAGRVPDGGDFSELPMDDPHYRPPMKKAQVVKFLRDARDKMTFPYMVNRDDYVKKFGWDAWVEKNRQEVNAFHEARLVISDALAKVIAR